MTIHENKSSRRLIGVRVKLNKDLFEIKDGEIIIGIKSKPEKGKANEELLKKLSKHFKVPISSVRIISGRTSRKKIVEIK